MNEGIDANVGDPAMKRMIQRTGVVFLDDQAPLGNKRTSLPANNIVYLTRVLSSERPHGVMMGGGAE